MKILDKNLKTLAYLDTKNSIITKTIDSEYMLDFETTVRELKTEYLNEATNFLEVAGQRFKADKLEVSKQAKGATTFNVKAYHISYGLVEKTFDEYNYIDTVAGHLNRILSGTGFSFLNTDITGTQEINIKLTNARYLVNKVAALFGGTVIWDKNNVSILKVFGNDLPLEFSIDKNLEAITASKDFAEKDTAGNYLVNYRVDVRGAAIKEFENCNIGDIVKVIDKDLKLDQKRKVIKTEFDTNAGINKTIELGDILDNTMVDDLIETIELNLDIELPENVITEVIHMQVINVETAHILNAWIKNLFVEYIETNMNARLDRTTIDRNFIRIINEKEEMVYQQLDTAQVEPLLIPDPNGGGGTVQVYYTAVGSHADAYRYFTITNPTAIHKDLSPSEVAAFRVMVKKVKKEGVKYKKAFEKFTLSSGAEAIMPIETWGEGVGDGEKGKCYVYKDSLGYTIKQMNDNNSGFCGIRLNETTGVAEYYNWINQKWMPIGSTVVGGAGNVIFHKDKTSLTNADLSNTNALHVGYSSTGTNIVGENSTIYTSGLVMLGAEIVTKAPPIDPPPQISGFKISTQLMVAYPQFRYWLFYAQTNKDGSGYQNNGTYPHVIIGFNDDTTSILTGSYPTLAITSQSQGYKGKDYNADCFDYTWCPKSSSLAIATKENRIGFINTRNIVSFTNSKLLNDRFKEVAKIAGHLESTQYYIEDLKQFEVV